MGPPPRAALVGGGGDCCREEGFSRERYAERGGFGADSPAVMSFHLPSSLESKSNPCLELVSRKARGYPGPGVL